MFAPLTASSNVVITREASSTSAPSRPQNLPTSVDGQRSSQLAPIHFGRLLFPTKAPNPLVVLRGALPVRVCFPTTNLHRCAPHQPTTLQVPPQQHSVYFSLTSIPSTANEGQRGVLGILLTSLFDKATLGNLVFSSRILAIADMAVEKWLHRSHQRLLSLQESAEPPRNPFLGPF